MILLLATFSRHSTFVNEKWFIRPAGLRHSGAPPMDVESYCNLECTLLWCERGMILENNTFWVCVHGASASSFASGWLSHLVVINVLVVTDDWFNRSFDQESASRAKTQQSCSWRKEWMKVSLDNQQSVLSWYVERFYDTMPNQLSNEVILRAIISFSLVDKLRVYIANAAWI